LARILVVDDDARLQEALVRLLVWHSYEVLIAVSGEEVIKTAQASAIDLVMLDFVLPGIDGHETLRAIRVLCPSVPVIMLTAHGRIRLAVEAIQCGAVNYIEKPFDNNFLLAGIARALAQRRELPDERAPCQEAVGWDAMMAGLRLPSGFVIRASADPRIRDGMAAIVKRFREPGLSLGQIATVAHLSADYFSKLFTEETGQTVLAVVHAARIGESAQLLRTTTFLVKEVAGIVGYHTHGELSSHFMCMMGCLPTQWRDGGRPAA
jgi:two-component system response regulator YesN